MNRIIAIISILIVGHLLVAQNVGINNSNPNYPLDVTGDINVSGVLLVQGDAGQEGDLLQSNGDGTMAWEEVGGPDLCSFDNIVSFILSTTWTVPAGQSIVLWGTGLNPVFIKLWIISNSYNYKFNSYSLTF